MRIRASSVLTSSVLFTIGLVSCVPSYLEAAGATSTPLLQELGFASLATIFVGLLVTWTGFIRRDRWAWFVMAIIVWVWAFPTFVLPYLVHNIPIPLTEWVLDAWRQSGPHRSSTIGVLMFAVLATALILPVKSFFWTNESRKRTP